MAQSSWPFENIDTSETQFSQWARNIGEGVKTGALNELEVFADSSGMQVKVPSGQALVRGHYYQSTAQETLTVTAADLSNPRIDIVVVELDPSANSIVLKVIAGSPAVSPSPQPLVQTDAGVYQIKLAEVLIDAAATTIAAGKVTDTRGYIEDLTGFLSGANITGQITVATIDGDRIINQIDTATIPGANVTGNITASQVNGALSNATIDEADVTGLSTTLAGKQDVVANVSDTEIGYLDGVTSAIQTQLDGKAPLDQTFEVHSSAYTLQASDSGKILKVSGTTTITVPASTLNAGARVDFINVGTGVITFAGSGLTINSADSALTIETQYAAATLVFDSTTTAYLIGAIA